MERETERGIEMDGKKMSLFFPFLFTLHVWVMFYLLGLFQLFIKLFKSLCLFLPHFSEELFVTLSFILQSSL